MSLKTTWGAASFALLAWGVACSGTHGDGGGDRDGGSGAGSGAFGGVGTTGSEATAGDGDGESNTGGTSVAVPKAPGTVVSTNFSDLPGGEPTACEWNWTVRQLAYHPGAIVPRRMYFGACGTETDSPKMFASMALGSDAQHPTPDPTMGALLEGQLDPATGTFDLVDSALFPECRSLHGIAVDDDCSTVAALCRTAWGRSGADGDAVAAGPDGDWMSNDSVCGDDKPNEQMWLYMWEDGDIQSTPKKYIVHKSIGSWEYGNDYLVNGENDNTYGIGMKATVGPSGACHEADTFLVFDRSTRLYAPGRGWVWACGAGHTLFNRPTYNPNSKQYGVHCGTDYNADSVAGIGAMSFHPEGVSTAPEVGYVYQDAPRTVGGVSVALPEGQDGFMGLVVATPGVSAPLADAEVPKTDIGLAHYDKEGNLVGEITWVVQLKDQFASYSQLTQLAEDRYLLGWGAMYRTDGSDSDDAFRVPHEYWVREIDSQGNAITEPQQLEGVGWGEQDQMVSLGEGRVGWAYIPDPALPAPSCNSDSLNFHVYQAADL